MFDNVSRYLWSLLMLRGVVKGRRYEFDGDKQIRRMSLLVTIK